MNLVSSRFADTTLNLTSNAHRNQPGLYAHPGVGYGAQGACAFRGNCIILIHSSDLRPDSEAAIDSCGTEMRRMLKKPIRD